MSPRGKPAGTWAKKATIDVTAEGYVVIDFPTVPLTSGERLHVRIQIGEDDLHRITIQGIWMDAPITAKRLKELPLEALRTACSKTLDRAIWEGLEDDSIVYEASGQALPAGDWIELQEPEEAPTSLALYPRSERSSNEFLQAIASIAREERARGSAAWRAVAAAAGVEKAQAQRYIAEAKERGFKTGTLKRKAKKSTPIKAAGKRGDAQ